MKIKTLVNNDDPGWVKIISKYISILYLIGLLGAFSACQKKTPPINEMDLFVAFAQDPKYGGDYAKSLPYDNPDSCIKRIRAEVPPKWQGFMCMNLFYHLPDSISDSLNLKYLDSFESAFPHDSVREFSQLLRGKIFIDQFQFDTARKCLEDCYASSIRGQRLTRAGDAKKYLGRMAVLRGNYPEGIQLMLEASEIYPLSKSYDESQLYEVIREIAHAYRLSQDYTMSQSWYLRLWQYSASIMDKTFRINAAVELADAYFTTRHLDSAQLMVDTTFALMKASNDYYYSPEAYFNLANLQVAAGNCTTALTHFWKAKRSNRTIDLPRLTSKYEKGVGDGYACLGKWDSAIFFYKKALLTPDTAAQILIYKQLAVAYKHKGAYKQALDAEMTNTALSERIFTVTKDNTIGYYIAKSEANRVMVGKQKEIDDQKLYTWVAAIIAVFILGLVGMAYVFYRREQKRKEELTALNATKDKLFALLSHDLISPVAVLKNYTLLMDWGSMNQAEFANSLQSLKVNLNNTSDMLENVLHWAISQMGGMRLKKEKVNLATAITEQIALVEPIAADKNIKLQLKVPTDMWLEVDKNHLALITRNLLQNALKFTHSGGTISFYGENTEGGKKLTLQDTGVGMSAVVLSQLFQINKDTQRTGTSKEKGTGLGLILTKELVELNGGKITVDSAVGKGTTFSLAF